MESINIACGLFCLCGHVRSYCHMSNTSMSNTKKLKVQSTKHNNEERELNTDKNCINWSSFSIKLMYELSLHSLS